MGSATDWVDPYANIADINADTYLGGVEFRLATFWEGRSEIPIMLTMGIGLYLIGAFCYRAGIFEERGRKLRRWIMAFSFGIGLPLDWSTRLFAPEFGTFNRYLTSAMVSIGILALVAGFYSSGRVPGLVGRSVSMVGRMALTCYLAQNLIASILMYPWGLGLAQYIPWQDQVWWDIVAWAAISLFLIGFSTWWLRRFSRGPVELAWHVSHEWIMRHMPYERYPHRTAATATVTATDGAPLEPSPASPTRPGQYG